MLRVDLPLLLCASFEREVHSLILAVNGGAFLLAFEHLTREVGADNYKSISC